MFNIQCAIVNAPCAIDNVQYYNIATRSMLNAYSYKEKMAAYDTTVCNMHWNVDNVWDQIWMRWESCQCSGLPHQILPKIRSFIDGQIIRSRTQAHRQLRLGCIFAFLPFCLVLIETFYLPLSFVHCTTVAVIQFCDFDEILLPSSFCIILCILHFKKFNQMCINQPFWENKVCNTIVDRKLTSISVLCAQSIGRPVRSHLGRFGSAKKEHF